MKTYALRFISTDVTVFNIGREDEWEIALRSAGLSRNLQAEDDENAIRQTKLFLNGFEEGSETFGIRKDYFKRVNEKVILLAPEGRKIDFTYDSLFEGLKEKIRTNLRKAKEERIKIRGELRGTDKRGRN